MHYKIEGTIRRNKNRFIIFAILWLFMTIVIVMPISYGINRAEAQTGVFNFGNFIEAFVGAYTSMGEVIGGIGTYFSDFISLLWKFTILYRNIYVYRICKNSSKE
ncbi:MAG: hypothetical protein HFJ50_02910 [Clostridia bacterium]|nr:hypothetical protein [Clostridia bacterium]